MNVFFARSRGRKSAKWKVISAKIVDVTEKSQMRKVKKKGKIEREKEI